MLNPQGVGTLSNSWPMSMPVPQPQWYQVTCPNCGSHLQVQLPEGITSVQCGNCKAVFAVQIQQAAFAQARPPGPMTVKRGRKKKEKTARPPRSPSTYNLFMKDEVANVKAQHPELRHRDAFKMAAERWADSPKNPQNKGKPGYQGVGAPGTESTAPDALVKHEDRELDAAGGDDDAEGADDADDADDADGDDGDGNDLERPRCGLVESE
jgi:ribosomal protein S27E